MKFSATIEYNIYRTAVHAQPPFKNLQPCLFPPVDDIPDILTIVYAS